MRNRLAVRILGLLAAAALLVTALAYAYFLSEETRVVRSEEERGAQLLVQAVDRGLQATMLSGNKIIAKQMLDDLVKVPQIKRIVIYSSSGALWHDSVGGAPVPVAPPSAVRRVADTGLVAAGVESVSGQEVYRALSPIPGRPACYACHQRRATLGVAEVVLSTAPARQKASADRQRLLATSLAIVGLSMVVLGLALTYTVIRPIRRLAGVARAIAGGDRSLRAQATGQDEIGELARAFNEMTDSLQENIEDLQTTRSDLQETVARVGEAISSAHRLADLLGVIAREAARIAHYEAATVLLFSDSGRLVAEAVAGIETGAVEAYNQNPLLRDASVLSDDPLVRGARMPVAGGRGSDRARLAILPDATAAYALPISHEGEVLGFLVLATKEAPELESGTLRLLHALAAQSGVAIQQIRVNERARTMAITDGLTGLRNHRYFHERVTSEIHRSERFDRPLALIMIDVDHFKEFNDRHGHLAGDTVLRDLGTLLAKNTRRADVAARYGGEEFAIILVETGRDEAVTYAERLRESIAREEADRAGATAGEITISAGVAAYPQDASSAHELIGAADAALYRAKAAGRNTVASASG